jgi:hypothetical protein
MERRSPSRPGSSGCDTLAQRAAFRWPARVLYRKLGLSRRDSWSACKNPRGRGFPHSLSSIRDLLWLRRSRPVLVPGFQGAFAKQGRPPACHQCIAIPDLSARTGHPRSRPSRVAHHLVPAEVRAGWSEGTCPLERRRRTLTTCQPTLEDRPRGRPDNGLGGERVRGWV